MLELPSCIQDPTKPMSDGDVRTLPFQRRSVRSRVSGELSFALAWTPYAASAAAAAVAAIGAASPSPPSPQSQSLLQPQLQPQPRVPAVDLLGDFEGTAQPAMPPPPASAGAGGAGSFWDTEAAAATSLPASRAPPPPFAASSSFDQMMMMEVDSIFSWYPISVQ